jgi:hypothetical protein
MKFGIKDLVIGEPSQEGGRGLYVRNGKAIFQAKMLDLRKVVLDQRENTLQEDLNQMAAKPNDDFKSNPLAEIGLPFYPTLI